jgi:hypothetical protein
MNLEQIRNKLNQQAQTQPGVDASIPDDWPKIHINRPESHKNRTLPRSTSPGQLYNTVEALRRRERGYGPEPSANPPSQGRSKVSGKHGSSPKEVEIHVKRLQALAEKINNLSSEQECLIGELKVLGSRLAHLQQSYPAHEGSGLQFPQINFDRAVLASVETDVEANLYLTYRSAEPTQSEKEAYAVANHLRGTYGPKAPSFLPVSLVNLLREMGIVWQEPATLASKFWHQLSSFSHQNKEGPFKAAPDNRGQSPRASYRDSMSLIDMLLWFGGGVIGRLALNLLLAAIPALWSLAVAVLTGITAYALYRATLAPRKDFGLASRVFLIIAGLVIGGQL